MKVNDYLPALEAVIFAGGEPITLEKLTEAMQLEESFVLELIGALESKLNSDDSGIRLVRLDNAYQLCTKAKYSEYCLLYTSPSPRDS